MLGEVISDDISGALDHDDANLQCVNLYLVATAANLFMQGSSKICRSLPDPPYDDFHA